MTSQRFACALAALLLVAGCTGVPNGVEPVRGFDVERYLGRWHEIARLDHSFERGMTDVTATYRRNEDGSIAVLNRGYQADEGEWSEAHGTAYFRGDPDVASLAVTFFWPFYGGYHVTALDPAYRWSLVCGPNRGYLWLLAREPQLDPALRERIVAEARELGFPTGDLIWVSHERAGD